MPTPLARLLKALGGGRLPPEVLRRIPGSILSCTDPMGPDFNLALRFVLEDLARAEARAYRAHLKTCAFCRDMCARAHRADWDELGRILAKLGDDVTQDGGES